MGKRKKSSRKPQGPKKKEKLPTSFECLFCNHQGVVTVVLDKKSGTGELHCKACDQQFQTSINYLSAAVDVYADWVDACDEVSKRNASGPSRTVTGAENRLTQSRPRKNDDEDDEVEEEDGADGYAEAGDNFIDDAEDEGHADADE